MITDVQKMNVKLHASSLYLDIGERKRAEKGSWARFLAAHHSAASKRACHRLQLWGCRWLLWELLSVVVMAWRFLCSPTSYSKWDNSTKFHRRESQLGKELGGEGWKALKKALCSSLRIWIYICNLRRSISTSSSPLCIPIPTALHPSTWWQLGWVASRAGGAKFRSQAGGRGCWLIQILLEQSHPLSFIFPALFVAGETWKQNDSVQNKSCSAAAPSRWNKTQRRENHQLQHMVSKAVQQGVTEGRGRKRKVRALAHDQPRSKKPLLAHRQGWGSRLPAPRGARHREQCSQLPAFSPSFVPFYEKEEVSNEVIRKSFSWRKMRVRGSWWAPYNARQTPCFSRSPGYHINIFCHLFWSHFTHEKPVCPSSNLSPFVISIHPPCPSKFTEVSCFGT